MCYHPCSRDLADIAREILRENRSYLDELATKDRLDSNSSVNKSFKWIDVLARRNEERMMNAGPGFRRPIQEDYKPHSQQVAMVTITACPPVLHIFSCSLHNYTYTVFLLLV